MSNTGSLKSTIAVSLTNYLDAGAIVAGASGLTLWQNYLGLSEVHLGWLNFISANCLGAAIGAIIGGFLADKYGRKFIFTYNLLVYMIGVLLVMFSMNFPMLLAGFLVTGISVGVGVPASWTYISESSEVNNRGRNICISQMSWGFGPMCILLFGMLFAPGGYLFGWVESIAHIFGGSDLSQEAVNVFSSRIVFLTLFIVAFIAWNLQRQLQESAEFTKSEGKEGRTDRQYQGAVLQQDCRSYGHLPSYYLSDLEPGGFSNGILSTAYIRDSWRRQQRAGKLDELYPVGYHSGCDIHRIKND